jgi:hypothetical protein
MNIEQVQKMTDEELRIKMAGLCGWKYDGKVWYSESLDQDFWKSPSGETLLGCLDYLHDLNAMHEAEKLMTREQQRKYTKLLHPKYIDNLSGDWCILHATARQRAEVFVWVMEEQE